MSKCIIFKSSNYIVQIQSSNCIENPIPLSIKSKKSNSLSKVQVYSRLPKRGFGQDIKEKIKSRKLSKKEKMQNNVLCKT